ncbi:hypothetical protein KEM60_01237 [Austwickia sp. TVS 96-490-7B]|uniref:hypothetical protein n=1 Tax=Austwickia sp. TVS 96-490-7B TaxID=2830843 RepID=UPI001C569C52|nr:hypothetical protein [Austwickia sp. TVS 96-490-7B]MBW3085045.1 hypothetical protein [Austwickia sp. TVS 96-490-7B]
MIMIGVALLVIAAFLALGGIWMTGANGTSLAFVMGPLTLTTSVIAVFIAGMVTVALLWAGVWLTTTGTRRSWGQWRHRSTKGTDTPGALGDPRTPTSPGAPTHSDAPDRPRAPGEA